MASNNYMRGGSSDASSPHAPSPQVGGGVGSVSPDQSNAEGGEDLMQDFVRLHMMSILHPFAEQIGELQEQVQQLTSEMAQKTLQVDQHKIMLHEQEHRLSAISATTIQADARIEATKVDLSSLRQEEAKLNSNHEMTKVALGKVDERLQSLVSKVDVVHQTLQDESNKVCKLQGGLLETDTRSKEVIESRLNNMHAFCKDLHDRHMDLLQSFQQAKAFGETTSNSTNKLMMAFDRQRQEDMEKFGCLNAHASGFEAKLNESNHCMQKQAEDLKAIGKDVQQLRTRTGQLVTSQQLQLLQSELTVSHKEQVRRLGKAEEDIAQLRSDAVAERKSVSGLVQVIEEKANRSLSDILRLKDIQQSHTDQIHSVNSQKLSLEHDQRKFGKRLDDFDREVQGLCLWQRGATEKFEVHSSELERTQGDMQQVHKQLQANDAILSQVKGEMGTAKEGLSKVSSRVELLHKYFHGLGKGLQDTHRHVNAGESGMLAPKSGFGMPLPPVIPFTPRGALASPKKPKSLLGDGLLSLGAGAGSGFLSPHGS